MRNLSALKPLNKSQTTISSRIALSHLLKTLLAAHSLAQFSLAEMAQLLLAAKNMISDLKVMKELSVTSIHANLQL